MPPPSRVLGLPSSLLLVPMILPTLAIPALVPVPEPSAGNVHAVTGRVTAVESPCCVDLEIGFADDARRFYLNRTLKTGVDLDGLQFRPLERGVEIEVVGRAWTPLDPLHRMAAVARITVDDEIVFDRLPRGVPGPRGATL